MSIDKIFISLILLIPLVTLAEGSLIEVTRVYWVWVVTELWLGVRLVGGKTRWGGIMWLSIALWLGVWGGEALVMGGNAIWGGWWRRQGWMTFAHLGMLAILVATSKDLGREGGRYLGRLAAATAAIAVGVGLAVGEGVRWGGGLGEINSWAMTAIILAALERKGIILAIPAIVVSQSRAALVAMAGVLAVNRFRIRRAVFIGLAGIMAGVLVWASWWRGGGNRIRLWEEAYELWVQRPWWGWGLDKFGAVFGQRMGHWGLEWLRYDQPHNIILWLLFSTGSVGTAVFAAMLEAIMRGWWKSVWGSVVIGLLVYGMWQPWSITAWVYLMATLGLILGAKMGEGREFVLKPAWAKLTVGALGWWFFVSTTWQVFDGYFLRRFG